ncbi:glycosyl hydrolase 108 family protein [Holospora curviuscula]|uniref:TtsA-like Glycoside hydrolase family 108 domain-containing protein n=1 Tax=Holospora curviuscula TaxID=1082868 RepID=A0A2S5R6Y4_9PROT|nr:glycosyl hydrolase 108 family protein [Holospora curviuscula]PPE03088.1 hypothetical protein HCUR_01519 [Holospora curviuscula]
MILQTLTAIWWAAKLDSRVVMQEEWFQKNQQLAEKVFRLEERIISLHKELNDLEARISAMANKNTLPITDERFEHAVSFILDHEGGYINDIDDDGGQTKFGISKRIYSDLDINALTVEQAKAIYKRDFWDPQLYKDIKDVNLATKVFDRAVNMGSNWAHRLV